MNNDTNAVNGHRAHSMAHRTVQCSRHQDNDLVELVTLSIHSHCFNGKNNSMKLKSVDSCLYGVRVIMITPCCSRVSNTEHTSSRYVLAGCRLPASVRVVPLSAALSLVGGGGTWRPAVTDGSLGRWLGAAIGRLGGVAGGKHLSRSRRGAVRSCCATWGILHRIPCTQTHAHRTIDKTQNLKLI